MKRLHSYNELLSTSQKILLAIGKEKETTIYRIVSRYGIPRSTITSIMWWLEGRGFITTWKEGKEIHHKLTSSGEKIFKLLLKIENHQEMM
jgi:predicted transcriptional regulator